MKHFTKVFESMLTNPTTPTWTTTPPTPGPTQSWSWNPKIP
ncbi:hypothetical protein [Lapillicoccus sp.]|nr:hypothetical protein [Lapillicoccus sp.]